MGFNIPILEHKYFLYWTSWRCVSDCGSALQCVHDLKKCHHIKDGYKSASPGHRTSPNRDSDKLVQFVNSEPGSKAPLSEAIFQILCNKKGMSFICRNLSACTWTRKTCCICLACPLNAHPKKKLVLEAVTQFYKELPRESPTGWSVDPTLLEVLLYNWWTRGTDKDLGLWGPLWPYESSFVLKVTRGRFGCNIFVILKGDVLNNILEGYWKHCIDLMKIKGTDTPEWVPGPLSPLLAIWGFKQCAVSVWYFNQWPKRCVSSDDLFWGGF